MAAEEVGELGHWAPRWHRAAVTFDFYSIYGILFYGSKHGT